MAWIFRGVRRASRDGGAAGSNAADEAAYDGIVVFERDFFGNWSRPTLELLADPVARAAFKRKAHALFRVRFAPETLLADAGAWREENATAPGTTRPGAPGAIAPGATAPNATSYSYSYSSPGATAPGAAAPGATATTTTLSLADIFVRR